MHILRRLLAVTVPIALVLSGCATVIAGQAVVGTQTTSSDSPTSAPDTADTSSEPTTTSPSGSVTPPDPTSSNPDAGTGPIDGAIPRPTPGGEGAGTVPAGLEEFYDQKLDWQSCVPFNDNADYDDAFAVGSLQCANLIVPMDYTDPSGATVTTAVIRDPSTGSDPQGSLQVNPGGPGASGLQFVASIATDKNWDPLREQFDLVGFDTRGLGASRPALTCQTDEEKDEARAANVRTTSDAGIQAMTDYTKDYVQQCQDRTGVDAGIPGADFLVTMGTDTTAKDMDVLRSALGDEKMTYLGFSYGTLLGSTYAAHFAGNVRALVLDGAVDPNADSNQQLVDQLAGFQGTFEAYATECAKSADCPLGTDPAQATAKYQAMTRPLLDAPLDIGDGRTLTYNDAITGTILALYSQDLWTYLTQGITALSQGDGYTLMALADFYLDRDSTGHYSQSQDILTAVHCMDDTRPPTDTGELQAATEAAVAAAPFQYNGDPVVATPSSCTFWPGTTTLSKDPLDIPDLPEVVVISTTGDPATPYQAGVSLAEQLNASLITVEGDSHTAYLSAGSSCVDDATTAYLVDLKLPGDITCN